MTDIWGPKILTIIIDEEGKSIWINTEFDCVFCAHNIKQIAIKDQRKSKGD